MSNIVVSITGAGSYLLVSCSVCGPVEVKEGNTELHQAGIEHLKEHGCTVESMIFTPPKEQP